MDNTATHEWVLDYGDYEAVLVCNNELPEWNTDSIIRAFQTYQFRDTSDIDDEIELTHIDGGSIVQYDGNVMAIRYSESFVVMLPDLVMALSSLGWKAASAYHNAESIALFMEDLGRSIPASVDFDVVPAGKDSHIALYPLGRLMLSDTRGAGLNAKEQLEVLAQEFNSLDQPAHGDISALKPTAPIILLEDPAFEGMMLDTVSVNTSRLQNSHLAKISEAEEPLVFQLPDQINVKSGSIQDINPATPQNNVVSIDSAKKSQLIPASKPSNIMQLGKGYLLFDLPDNPLTETSISTMLGEEFIDASQYVHLYPGKLNNPLHWNLLGEIPADNPQFADTLVRFMGLGLAGHDRALLSALLANVSQLASKPDLRTVLNFIILKCAQDTGTATFGFYEEKLSSTASNLIKYSDYAGIKSALLKYAGQIALIPDSRCILDMNTLADGNYCGFEEFSLRDMMKQETPWVYFIHCSKDDSMLARWISILLYHLTTYLQYSEKPL